ncbi:DUF3158 family protein [Saezia sanguinis]|uniref:DUF3158 family protein n=1 Tax=Saezia sanguinis TaxID=1965230 RepID=UPI0030552E8B
MTQNFFSPLEQAAFQKLKQGAFLKGLLKPFKGNRDMALWASQCEALRDQLMALAQQEILSQAQSFPFALLPVQLTMQSTGSGTAFLRWRNIDRSAMGVALWEEMMDSVLTPVHLLPALRAMEQQRLTLNMQISVLHMLARQAQECTTKMEYADAVYQKRINQGCFNDEGEVK